MSNDADLLTYATGAAALGCGLNAGVFFAFSAFVMPALNRLPATQAIPAMQSINRLAVTPPFMAALFGTALLCAGLAAHGVTAWGETASTLAVGAAALYLLGTIGLTIVHHVPLNDALATVQPHAADAARRWADYVGGWVPLNHVRAACALGASGLLLAALRLA